MKQHLLSVIIPCYNHAHFVGRAVDSVLFEDLNCEIIVINNGSTDGLAEVLKNYPTVKSFYMDNRGVSPARNAGLKMSTGKYVVFLDADDWILPGGLSANVEFLEKVPKCAMAVGAHIRTQSEDVRGLTPVTMRVNDSYLELLKWNYIQMFGSVIFRSEVLKKFYLDDSVSGAEDYDLFLRIARDYKICHHHFPVAAYFIHDSNFSRNYFVMLEKSLTVLRNQRPFIRTRAEEKALKRGEYLFKKYFTIAAYNSIKNGLEYPLSKQGIDNLIGIKKTIPTWFYHLKWQYPKQIRKSIDYWKNDLSKQDLNLLKEGETSLLSWNTFKFSPRDYFVYFAKRILRRA